MNSDTSMTLRAMIFLACLLVLGAKGIPAETPAPARADTFEAKMRLLERAWQDHDFELARSLTHSLRDTVIQTQVSVAPADSNTSRPEEDRPVTELPPAWQAWVAPWRYFRVVSVTEAAGIARRSEPVELALTVPAHHSDSLYRDLRIAKIQQDGTLHEVTCQVHSETRHDAWRQCKVLWLADVDAHATGQYLLLLGNPHAEFPLYPSDLTTTGEGVGLDIVNSHFKARLSRQTGQLERLTFHREHGLELFSGGEGHGEPPGIDWAHDYVDEGGFQKMRISLWDQCPDYEVVRGPLCTIVRRWGFPYSPIHPIFAPSRLLVTIEYRFFSGQPWFLKMGTMEAIQDLQAEALRDDEWVFSGQSFTEKVWMARD